MSDKHAKYGAATGIIFVVLFVIGFMIVFPKPPDADASASTVSQFFIDEQGGIRAAAAIISLALVFFLWFLGSLTSALRSAAGNPRLPTVAFAGGLLGAAFMLMAITVTATAAYHPETATPAVTQALSDIGVVAGAPAAAAFTTLFGATALVILRGSALPHWLGWTSAVAAVCQPLAIGVMFTDSGNFAGDGVLGLFVPVLTFLLGIAALSVVLIGRVSDEGGLASRLGGAVWRATGST